MIKDNTLLNKKLKELPTVELITYFFKKYPNKVALASSLGLEDQVLTHMLVKAGFGKHIFTLDTGRLFPQTYDILAKTNKKYNLKIKVFFPDNQLVEDMVNTHGINLFYDSIENRKLCCKIRKINPLKRAFKDLQVWICGLRKEQSANRQNVKLIENDKGNNLLKVNPLINWTLQDIWDYINKHNVPYNALHKKGYVSIGCEPCTRAITKKEDFRDGRWWWEKSDKKECGLHR